MGNKHCGQFCHNDKNEIVHVEIVPGSDVSDWGKSEQRTTIPKPFKVEVSGINEISLESRHMQGEERKEGNWEDSDGKQMEEEQIGRLPPIEIQKQQSHFIVPHNLVASRVSPQTQLLMRKQFPTSPLVQPLARWYLLPSGNYYNGQLISQHPFGIGTYLLPTKVFYGQTQNTKPQGMGVIISDQYIFKGQFQNGRAKGQATLESQVYNAKGVYVEGKMVSGKVMTREFVYEGEFVGGKPEGKGFYRSMKKGLTYEGEFHDGKFHGIGNYSCEEYSYHGRFVNGMKDGEGKMDNFRSGKSQKGIWQEDRLVRMV